MAQNLGQSQIFQKVQNIEVLNGSMVNFSISQGTEQN